VFTVKGDRYRQFYRTFLVASALLTQRSWTHYKTLIGLDDQDKRAFSLADAAKNNWSARQLERQLNSQLCERLLLSNDVAAVLAVARQEHLHLHGDDFFVDLVFYNRLQQCFVLVEIKTDKLTHQDLGQFRMYVNYYDHQEKLSHENPTIGILLCTDKNDAVVKISLPTDNQTIVANKYQLYLPTEQALMAEVKKEIDKLD